MSVLMVPNDSGWPTLGPLVCDFIETYLVFGPGDLRGEPARLDRFFPRTIHRPGADALNVLASR